PKTDKGYFDNTEVAGLSSLIKAFGGTLVFGAFQNSMDVAILKDVPSDSGCLYQEYPGPLVALIPYYTMDEAIQIAQKSLKLNHRNAWTAVNFFGPEDLYQDICKKIDSYHFLRNGITARLDLLCPHQGNYFAFDLVRRVAIDRAT